MHFSPALGIFIIFLTPSPLVNLLISKLSISFYDNFSHLPNY